MYQKERDRVEALLEKGKVTIAFTGHEHFYMRQTVGGVVHIVTGVGGALFIQKR